MHLDTRGDADVICTVQYSTVLYCTAVLNVRTGTVLRALRTVSKSQPGHRQIRHSGLHRQTLRSNSRETTRRTQTRLLQAIMPIVVVDKRRICLSNLDSLPPLYVLWVLQYRTVQ